MLTCVAGRCGHARRNGSKWGRAVDRFYSQQNIELYRKLFDRATDEPHRRLLFDVLAVQTRGMVESERLEFTSSGAAINIFGSFAALAIFGRSSFPRLFIRLRKRPEPPEMKCGRVFWRVQPRDRRERNYGLVPLALRQKPISPPTNPHRPLNQAPANRQTLQNP